MKKKSTSQLVRPSLGEAGLPAVPSSVPVPSGLRRVEASRERGFLNLRVLLGLCVMLAGVFLALVSFGPARTGFAQGTTREQMTLALAQALNISQPPACVPGQEMFHDVPASSPFCPFIEELARRGITGGCGGGNYCPSATVNREQMAVFIVKAIAGVGVVITDPRNTAVGDSALFNNTTGTDNTATGYQALFHNTDVFGSHNTADGSQALFNNIEGSNNTAVGYQALFSNVGTIGGAGNTAIGSHALQNNISGSASTAVGLNALFFNNSPDNTAVGNGALVSATGSGNTALGASAATQLTTGDNNIAIGRQAGSAVTGADNVICIGAQVAGQNTNNRCFIGNIYNNVQPAVGIDPDFVTINSSGRLGRSNISSRRYKHDIKPMDKASEVLFALKPVSFRYNKEYDATQTLAFGLIAEEVADVYPDLVGRNPEGQPESVRYEQINAMLLNEFLKEHKKVEEQSREIQEQKATIVALRKGMENVIARVKEQESKIEKVSA
jgi:hypothetical protein